ncbi:MAG: hypothetical protein KC592_13520 [Nitrospira sp.]|nr:hypothetical protein [Nitrospira sp.]HBP88251.1 hypothetical protein [Nitrospiraceae bacterium]HNP28796.1 hypothetical protein [Nitrospirales bacterium]
MGRILTWDIPESVASHEHAWNPKRKNVAENIGLVTHRASKGSATGATCCAKCGSEVKVFVSPRRNPHSSKLGRAVSLKDHDLCRRCWRKMMYQQRQAVVALSLSFFVRKKTPRPRLLVPILSYEPKQAC